MNKQKIAILTDSGSDVPKYLVDEYGMYVAPLKIIYSEGEYLDGVTISAEDVYSRLKTEIPSTSLPDGKQIQGILDQIKRDGYEKVLVITISSGLSGTNNVMRVVGEQQKDLDVFVVDTKNISIASGFNAIQAAEYIKEGMEWEELKEKVSSNILNSIVFFSVGTLEYLQKGGRIGLVTSIIGSGINLKPIISCNQEGIYYTAAKMIGKRRSFSKALELAVEFIGDIKEYNLGVVHGAAKEDAARLAETLKSKLPNFKIFVDGQISPALGVHTGPGAIGIVAQKLSLI